MVTIPHAYDKWQRTGLLVAMIGIATTGGEWQCYPRVLKLGNGQSTTDIHYYPFI